MTKVQPMNGYILAKEIKEEKTSSGIILAAAQHKSDTATVVATSEIGIDNGILSGDTIIYKVYAAIEVKQDGESYIILSVDDILAKVIGD